jgi:hypothetical protein
MSLDKSYALVKDGKIDNIILCNPEIIEQFSQDLEVDSFIELTDSNYKIPYNKPKPGDWVNGDEFVCGSWTKNEDGTFTPPVPEPEDGKVYEWHEETSEWVAVTPYPSWSWDPVTRISTPPHDSPRGLWIWNEDNLDWDPAPEPPQDGELYRWDAVNNEWVIVLP